MACVRVGGREDEAEILRVLDLFPAEVKCQPQHTVGGWAGCSLARDGGLRKAGQPTGCCFCGEGPN